MSSRAEQKEKTHEEILSSAARLLREHGISGASVAEVMKGAGLTVGGFYAHFASKEELIDAALRRTLGGLRTKLLGGLDEKTPTERIETVLRRYLSRAHRDEVSEGCPLPAVLGEIATDERAGQREILADELTRFANELDALYPPAQGVPQRQRALAMIALMAGGLSLARAVRATPLSDEILRACRAYGRAALRGFEVSAEERADGRGGGR